MTNLLVKKAFADSRVLKIQAHTLPDNLASERDLQKCQFQFIEEHLHEQDGIVRKWERSK